MDPESLVGNIFDEKFHIISVAGTGGMGVVYKARQIALDRVVAIKILRPGLVKDNEFKLRFDREAQILSTFSHQHVGMFYSYGEGRVPSIQHSLPYIAMEFMQGESLQSLLLSAGALPWRRATKICKQICQGMIAAHQAGVVHRDLKPANIILLATPEQDFVKIVDFGLAIIVADTNQEAIKLTRTGDLVGTPTYFSPEQCQGKAAESRSDIYALGCILYEMLCGKPPFTAESPVSLIYKHVKDEAEELSKRTGNELPPGIEMIVTKAMSKTPEDRYQSM
ncbi:MAG: serine/threonine protein kinase, partial [Candidatus Obscuribacterales bacterium]|nr:serine/threonine protein kinase [Candidatus Obscuribacterales bacterium]